MTNQIVLSSKFMGFLFGPLFSESNAVTVAVIHIIR